MSSLYAIRIDREGEDFVVTCRDLPEVCTSGDSREEALDLAADAVDVIVQGRIEDEEDLPLPSPPLKGEDMVSLPAMTAAKATIYRIWKASGISKTELAARLGVNEKEARRILDPRYGTRLETLERAAKALGQRLVIDSRAA